jgi:hypothetical protein
VVVDPERTDPGAVTSGPLIVGKHPMTPGHLHLLEKQFHLTDFRSTISQHANTTSHLSWPTGSNRRRMMRHYATAGQRLQDRNGSEVKGLGREPMLDCVSACRADLVPLCRLTQPCRRHHVSVYDQQRSQLLQFVASCGAPIGALEASYHQSACLM